MRISDLVSKLSLGILSFLPSSLLCYQLVCGRSTSASVGHRSVMGHGAVGSVFQEKPVYSVLFIIKSRSHGFLSHSPRKWDIIIMLVTSSFSFATTHYPIYSLSQFFSLSLRTAAAVQEVKKDLMSLLCNFIFVSCLLVRDTEFCRLYH